jgi:putative DNA primase/helicase
MQAWEAKRSGLKDKIRELAKKQNSTLTIENALNDLEFSKPVPPRVPKLLHTDITPEKLGHFLANEWPSGGVVSNEAGAVFGSHGMGKDSIMRNLALLNTLWDGGEISSERKSTEGYTLRGARFTMGLQVQEATLREFFSKSGTLARGTGFLARFLISWPKSNMGKRLFTEAPVAWPYLEAFNRRLTVILNAPPPLNNGVLTPHLIGLSDAAKQSWIHYHDMVEIELNTSGDYFDIRDVAAKSADNAARLAGLFERFANSDGGSISQDSFQRGAKVAAWHLEEAKRFFGEIGLPQVVLDAVRLESWLIHFKHKEELSTRYIQRCGPFRDKKLIDPALAELESLYRIKLVQEGRRKLIKVNPMVLK